MGSQLRLFLFVILPEHGATEVQVAGDSDQKLEEIGI